MENPTLNEVIKASPVLVHRGRYAYLKGQEKELKNHFLISQDNDEITIVTEEKNIANTKYEKDVKWFKLFEFKVSIPFLAPGFLAKISKTIADKKMNILLVSTFSKDYALIREEDFKVAVKALEEVGFSIKVEE
ncbi:hypothetical protein A3F08_03510 [Candidatus Berkelbacteria bacterium RIFCSPHIGHO2_12_FULL_36_9]|uniref:CASTOR ACT domain-containing protein n=1 Tax=Candidatus Berkelbacteria bacterium RIFCSPHIGHO2_12_FULL_36_9 TaxID=1797469 RepID=A0A1F5EL24_9BACT|nr:MAG: hypothetical protein A3F08_03510 [Candidatus Berkelbacteria bacterium RIFCSPHIGHO2_12_FULL_36_9]